MNNKFPKIYFGVLFIFLAIISYRSFFYPPMSDYWQMFYFFHNLDNLPDIRGLPSWFHVANLDPVEQMRYQPLSHFFYYILHKFFGANYLIYNLFNFLLYFLSLILLYRFSLRFSSSKMLTLISIGVFSVLFTHFDIILWSCHIYIIAGLCFFLMGFMAYFNFLQKENNLILILVFSLFLLGLWCYEAFFFWPFSLLLISSLNSEGFNNKSKVKIRSKRRKTVILMGWIYSIYFAGFAFTRWLDTYTIPLHEISQFIKVKKVLWSGLIALFNILYNGVIINILPFLSYPLKVSENVYLCGPLIKYLNIYPLIVAFFGSLIGLFIIFSLLTLYKKKEFKRFRISSFLLFLIISFFYVITFCRLGHDNRINCCIAEFRYQYIPNAIFIVLVVFVFQKLFLAIKNKKWILFFAGWVFIANVVFIWPLINIYDFHLRSLKVMLSSIKSGIKEQVINQKNRIYIDDSIHDYMPSLCWNIEMGERFIEGNYKWVFPGDVINVFSDNLKEAVWVVDKESFKIVRKDAQASSNSGIVIKEGKNEQYANLGYFYLERNNYKKTDAIFKKAIEINSNNVIAYNALILSYERQLRYKDAEDVYKEAIINNSYDSVLYSDFGYFYNRLNRFEDAENKFKESLKLNAKDINAYNGLITSLKIQKKYDKAEKVYKAAIENNINKDNVYSDLGHFYNCLGRFEDAEIAFKEAIKINHNCAVAYDGLAVCYKGRKMYDVAEKMFKKAVKLGPRNDVIYADFGHLYNELGRFNDAEKVFKRSLAINPYNQSAYYGLGVCYKDQKLYIESEVVFQNAIKLGVANDMIYMVLGNLYEEQGRTNEAKLMYERALSVNLENEMSTLILE